MSLRTRLFWGVLATSLVPLVVFILAMYRGESNQIKELLISAIIILVCLAFFVLIWVYTSILRPLENLRVATRKIKEGDLDFTLEIEAHDEIGELCLDFEEMRMRLKENRDEKLQADRDAKELISNISHDLKTPLTAIKGYVEGIRDGVASSPEKLDNYIKTIYNKANDMDRLIDELTFYSRIDTNKIPYHFNRIHIVDFFTDCAEEVGVDMKSRNIKFSFTSDVSPDCLIIADAEQMKRVVNNIISNSVKYLDKTPGEITIKLIDEGDFVRVEIADNGKGIAKKDLTLIFDRFYRTDSSRNSAMGGSGIGLSIVKKIVEDHGGKIWASSKEGVGTILIMVLRKEQGGRH